MSTNNQLALHTGKTDPVNDTWAAVLKTDGLNVAQSGNQGEGRDERDNQQGDGKTT